MTKELFYDDVMLRECQAMVTDCVELKKGYGIVLDQTVFFPEGGGQLSDVGVLALAAREVAVTHVRTKDGVIYHETAEPIAPGTPVAARLDWQTRMDHMQQHAGEHLLSYAFWQMYGADNVGFHMQPDMVAIDLSHEVTDEEATRAETFANAQVMEDRPITARYLPHTEAARLTTRKFNDKIEGMLRIVTIDGSDVCTCCGTHPPTTGMIGPVKIFKTEKHKEGTRVYFLCGRLAVAEIARRMSALATAARSLSIKDEDVAEGVARLAEENKNLREELHTAQTELINIRAAELIEGAKPCLDDYIDIRVIDDSLTPHTARALAQRLAEEPAAAILVAYTTNARLNYIVARGTHSGPSAKERIAAINKALDGKGGGKETLAQGSAPLVADWQEKIKSL